MKISHVFGAALLGLTATAHAATYEIDAAHTNARFAIDHFNTSTNVGDFFGLTGSMEFDKEARKGKIDITIPIDSLQTDSEAFTGHLKSADLFNAEAHPNMRFESTKFN